MHALHPFRLVIFSATLTAGEVSAQVIFTNPITGTNPNTSSHYTTGQTVAVGLTVTGIGRGTGISGSNSNDRYNASGWNSGSWATNDYFTWTVTPNSGYQLSLASFAYTGQTSGTGPTSFEFRSGVDGFSSSIGTATATGTTITLSSGSFQGLTTSLEFRLYGWGASSSGGTFSVNDFTFNGTVSAVPEPSTYAALAGAAALGLAFWRRHHQRPTAPLAKIDQPRPLP
ncbi:MAG: PEP-CTERM sorting domain-containing protein [Opitutus sp.]|nr:PEP-CTERM sorting domain-containing protein [Opitutus sp.]